ncbi:hypothetical protein CLV78_111123 [Aliiruegeria haliotis]|uniref:Probable membrane transporter protein n=1 Tax=Aliiruegeria haliotis TaxID=1280846 RepID=A0A2T0RII7_9RHOB|nr:sulfite exporter TauE/SafE family protein [Aliiruegeria haliotis]PRY20968.1 hypothetical protein CLV78_111123 [Aliiruegeria haliotis]
MEMHFQLALSLGVVFIAGLLRGFTGFGAVMMIVPAFALFDDVRAAVPIGLFMDLVAGLLLLPRIRRHICCSLILPMGILALATIPLGVGLLAWLDPDLSRRMIAVLVMLFAVVLAAGWRYRGPITRATSAAAGAIVGLLVGWTGMGGPPAVAFVLSTNLDAGAARASLTGLFLATTSFALLNLAMQGMIGPDILLRAATLAPAFMAGTWIGGVLFDPQRESLYRLVTLSSLATVSIAVLIGG